ncbi:MAG: alpha-glucosidase/alpha-galactosidase [Chloroflexi bacterium]|nr:alpha-glucosidase/alpha-galactosidase [Chloroflexota bacterium]
MTARTSTKIVLIGAGSTSFGVSTLADLFKQAGRLRGSTIALCDVNTEKLAHITRLAQRLNDVTHTPFVIESARDYREVLAGAQFVLVSVEVDRLERWQLDWQIPLKHGIRHVLGENGGPGGLSHALRTSALVLDIARAVERAAPDAYLINFTNPLSRVCLALTRYTRLKVVGLCHQINKGYYIVGRVLGLTPPLEGHFPPAPVANALKAQFDLKTAGLNHFTWITDMREAGTGRDLYPEFCARLRDCDPGFEPLSRRLHDAFGLFPTSGDGHLGEYFGYAHETSDLAGYDFEGRAAHSADLDARVARASQNGQPLDEFLHWESGERTMDVVAAIANNLNGYEQTVNVLNNGALPGLPDWAVVEVPAIVGGGGVMPLRMPALPPGITALLNQQVAIQDRVVEAAVHGDRRAALQSLLLDPLITNYTVAEELLDELLAAHAPVLPAFAGKGDE